MKTDSAKEPDVVRVVRCKDCVFAIKVCAEVFSDGCMVCSLGRGFPRYGLSIVLPRNFCDDGKKEYEEGEHETN